MDLRVTLKQLEAFEAVATHGTFGRAADALGRAQPTVSKEVRALERTLGTELVIRQEGPTRLSPEGVELLERARAALTATALFERTARDLGERAASHLTVACSPSIANRFMPHLLQRLETEGPKLTVLEIGTGQVEQAVATGEADLGLGHFARAPQGCRRIHLGDDPLVLVGHPDLLGDLRTTQDLASLDETPLLVWPRENHPAYFDAIMTGLLRRGLEPHTLLQATDRLSGSHGYLLGQGRAVAVVPVDAAESLDPELLSLPLGEGADVPFDAVIPHPPKAVVDLVLATCRRIHAELRGGGEHG